MPSIRSSSLAQVLVVDGGGKALVEPFTETQDRKYGIESKRNYPVLAQYGGILQAPYCFRFVYNAVIVFSIPVNVALCNVLYGTVFAHSCFNQFSVCFFFFLMTLAVIP